MIKRVAIGIPTCGPPTWGLLDSIVAFQSYHHDTACDMPLTIIRPPRPLPIAMARQYVAHHFIQNSDANYLWWIDQDCFFKPETLSRLMAWDKPIVGALCLMRLRDFVKPMVMRGEVGDGGHFSRAAEVYLFAAKHFDCGTNEPQLADPIPDDALFEVDYTGCHCLLTKREVYENTPAPWFSDVPGREDRFFMLKAQEHNYQAYVDFSTMVGHGAGAERSLGMLDFMAHFRYANDIEEARQKNG